MFILCEYPSTLEECFQSPIEGAIYAELIDRLRAEGAIRPAVVDNSCLGSHSLGHRSAIEHCHLLFPDCGCRVSRYRL
jgi:hypothetical protein